MSAIDGQAELSYAQFLSRKSQGGRLSGFEPVFMLDALYPFQRHLVDWAVRKGRAAIFANFGLGKGPMSLTWAQNVVQHTGRPVLILAPLAVSQQFVREGDKFGIKCSHSRDGKPKGDISTTNYEKLHLFCPDDYSGVVLDECFPAGTPVDSVSGTKSIETLREGDTIVNAFGLDTITRVHKRKIYHAIALTIREGEACKRIVVSQSHQFFTCRGWVSAQDLEPGDALLQTGEAVRMVRESISSSTFPGVGTRSFLRQVLFSELADEHTRAQGEGSQSGDVRQAWEVPSQEVSGRRLPWTGKEQGAHSHAQPDVGPRDKSQGQANPSGKGGQASCAGRQRERADPSRASLDGCSRSILETDRYSVGETANSRLSDPLQTGLRERLDQGRHRSGWGFSLQPEGVGQEEGREVGFARVDSVEVLEQGHPELDRYRDADGSLYFYDLSVSRHPSYSVHGLLVHNCSIVKHWTGATQKAVTRFLSKVPYRLGGSATPSPNDFTELGTIAEVLGEMTYSDMLAMFFRQMSDDEKKKNARADDVIHSRRLSWRVIQSIGKWAMKAHAFEPFWKWVSSWARACRKPSDLGDFDDSPFVLPPLIRRDHIITPKIPPPGMLFTLPAIGLNQERGERRRTLSERVDLVKELVKDSQCAIIWVQLNDEGNALERDIPGSVQIQGSDSLEFKEQMIEWFVGFRCICGVKRKYHKPKPPGEECTCGYKSGRRRLITKAKIAGHGLNLQCCNHIITFVDHSWEKFSQSVARCHRFGQKHPVTLDVIATEGEVNVKRNMDRKERLAGILFDSVIKFMNDSLSVKADKKTVPVELPSWLNK